MGLTGVDMAHLVRHRAPSGEVVTSEVADLDAAVALVERLRNDEGAEDVRVFAEVPLRFETYVKVSVGDEAAEPTVEPTPSTPPVAEVPPPPAAPVPPPPGVLAPARIEAPSADAEELVDVVPVDGRKGLFRH